MRLPVLVSVAIVGLSLQLAAPGRAAVPQNRADPCSNHGRNSCGTLGIGFYKQDPDGFRWLGDYRGAVPGVAHLFCIDARFWYAAPAYDYQPKSSLGLENRNGYAVSVENQERMAYAIWNYGRSTDPGRQIAVALYTHALMGDMTPAEVDPTSVTPAVASHYARIENAAIRYHGPYRIEVSFPRDLVVARPATVSIRVVAASGAALPNVGLTLRGEGVRGLAAQTQTGSSGTAHVRLVPESAAGLRLRLGTSHLASTRPRIYAATSGAAAANGQRLAAPSAQQVTRTVTVAKVHVAPRVVTLASSQETVPGTTITDRVEVSGLGGMRTPVRTFLWGPYESPAAITCTGVPYWTGSLVANGDGTYETPAVRVDQLGYYAYTESVKLRPGDTAYASRCGETAETIVVRATPQVTTVGTDVVRPGTYFTDRMRVGGLGTTSTRISVELYGPFASSRQVTCSGRPRWSGSILVNGNGEFKAPPVRVEKPGVYMFRYRVPGSTFVTSFTTSCSRLERTTIVAPRILTGRGDAARPVSAPSAGGQTPVRLRLARLGIDAPISAVGIDLQHGVLAIPADIHRLGWWRDSRTPSASSGSMLLAGHVDNAKARIGALFDLHEARVGDRIEVRTANRATHAYSVTSIRTYPKNQLPLDVYSRAGGARLVLVTCGGVFDKVSGHYPDNIVVTAAPVDPAS